MKAETTVGSGGHDDGCSSSGSNSYMFQIFKTYIYIWQSLVVAVLLNVAD